MITYEGWDLLLKAALVTGLVLVGFFLCGFAFMQILTRTGRSRRRH